MPYWVQVNTADGNKVVGHAAYSDPADRTQLNDGALQVKPDTDAGLSGIPPEDLYSNPPFDMTPNYQWNGVDDIEEIP